MANKILALKVPGLGESVTEATLAKWRKNVGDPVAQDETIVELETDKVTMEVNSPANGFLKAIDIKEGSTVKVGDKLGEVEEGAAPAVAAPASTPSTPAPEEKSSKPKESAATISSPAASKMISEKAIDPKDISATGKDGRVTKEDVLNFLDIKPAPKAVTSNEPREERVKMSRLRQTIAKRLKEAQNTAAMLTTFNEIDMTNVMAIRSKLQERFEKKHGVKLGFMSFFVKSAIVALKEIPAVNAEIDGEFLVYKNFYDIGVAVGTPSGLVVPILRDADQKSFADIEKEINELASRARDGKLSMQDLTGGTFTISNGGVYGSLMSTPILNPPQSGILGMHKIQKRPVVIDDKIEIRPMMYLALSYDHRVIDGKEAVTFLVRLKECLEDPERILLNV